MPDSRPWPDRFGGAAGRLCLSVTLGLVLVFVLPHGWTWTLRCLAGWSVGEALFLALCWMVMLRADGPATKARCRQNDASRGVVDTLLTFSIFASVVAVCVALHDASADNGLPKPASVGVPIVAVVLAWLLVHTLYALHYAKLYYHNDDDPDGPPFGGMDFREDPPEPPDYRDFLYVSFGIACTYGVTDTILTSKLARRTVTKHSILSFAFATIVLALAVNVITSLLSSK